MCKLRTAQLGTACMKSLFWSPSVGSWHIGTKLPAFTLPLILYFPYETPPKIWLVSVQIKSLSSSLPPSFPLSFHIDLAHVLRIDIVGFLLNCPPHHTYTHISICDRTCGIWWSTITCQCPDCSRNLFIRLYREKLNCAV